jgi:hypothetical protein
LDKGSRLGQLITLVRKLIDYGKEFAATFQQRDATLHSLRGASAPAISR